MSRVLETERLVLRPWEASDVEAAVRIYGAPSVARWVTSEHGPAGTDAELRAEVLGWAAEDPAVDGCTGHWAVQQRAVQHRAVQQREPGPVVGAVSLQLTPPPDGESIAVAWALDPQAWGHGYAAEAGDALVRWAIHEQGAIEVFAVVQPDNARAAATAERIGMEWVTELGHLSRGRYQVYRIRHGDLDYED